MITGGFYKLPVSLKLPICDMPDVCDFDCHNTCSGQNHGKRCYRSKQAHFVILLIAVLFLF